MTQSSLSHEQSVELEQLVDEHSLGSVLLALVDIARQKAEHLRTNWQDPTSAGPWDKAAGHIAHFETLIRV